MDTEPEYPESYRSVPVAMVAETISLDRVDFPDGSRIDIRASGNGNPPDQQFGQHTNRSTLWARKPDGYWRRVERLSRWRAATEAHEFDNADDAMEWICGKEGD